MFHALGDFVENIFGVSSDAAGLIIGIPALIFLIYYYSKKNSVIRDQSELNLPK